MIPPNPVAVITGPNTVKEGRPITLSGKDSYSPVGANIVGYEWEVEGASYVSALDEEEITLVFDEVGQFTISLSVWDDSKTKSLTPASIGTD